MDSTAKTFMSKFQASVVKVPDSELISFLQRYIRRKKKYYAIVEFIQSGMSKTSEEMERIIVKHHLRQWNGDYDMKRLTNYILSKLSKYPFKKYPSNTLLVCDDKKLLTNLISKNQIILTKEDLENVISRITNKQCVIEYLDPEIECCGQTPIFMKIGNIRIIETPGTAGVEFKYRYSNEYTKLSSDYKLCLKYVLLN
ncbi:hypothetical protein TVAG_523450 [Trichomonas vaginalis G3]|uniref:Uncharacterized protein n=1 Tax=Trichomonas vaginalis (strain ATCC PRA-98 / G3) TaxID=412133 RepID=A2GPF0_TRIV3|nr:hypothetical protein TVAG_523450 [Trichomonas vaginalis G3]|eukprot:XP_001293897.1 hypothetical protein [Trichomonas vaginalis G3]